MPGFQAADSRMAPMMPAISGRLISPRKRTGSAIAGADSVSRRANQKSSATNIASTRAAAMAVS